MSIPLFPYPQWARALPRSFALTADARLSAHPDHLMTAHFLVDQLREQHLLTLDVGTLETSSGATITIDTLENLPAGLPAEVLQTGGYMLSIDAEGIRIVAYDAAGAFYGVQSLLQLIAAARAGDAPGENIVLPGIQVYDWPYKPLRGIHLYMPGRKDIPFFKRLLAWIASLKYNVLFLEVGGGMEYKRRPEINRAWEKFCAEADAFPGGATALYNRSLPFLKDSPHTELGGGSYLEQEEVADLLAYARSLHIEVIPEVQALSHTYYLCCAYPEIAERADDPWPDTCCPSHPETYTVLFDVMAEVIEVFNPRMIHIGHDEVYHMGHCPRCQGKHPSDLLADEILRIHEFLAPQGIRLAMWGDKLLPFDAGGQGGVTIVHERPSTGQRTVFPETYQAIERLPRDILMSEWLGNRDPRAINFFLKQGFEVCCGNFGDNFAAQAFIRWQDRGAASGVLGGEVSTWCQVSEFALAYNGCVFNILFSAPLLWWSHYRDLDRDHLLRDVAERMPAVRRWLGEMPPLPEQVESAVTSQSLSLGQQSAPEFAPSRPAASIDTQKPALAILVGKRVDALRFTHSCITAKQRRPTWAIADPYQHPPDNLLALYTIHYADGSQVEIPIHYGTHIARWDIPYGESIDAIPYAADPIAIEREASGRRVTIYQYEWANPRPHKLVDKVTLTYAGDESGTIWIFDIDTLQRVDNHELQDRTQLH